MDWAILGGQRVGVVWISVLCLLHVYKQLNNHMMTQVYYSWIHIFAKYESNKVSVVNSFSSIISHETLKSRIILSNQSFLLITTYYYQKSVEEDFRLENTKRLYPFEEKKNQN